MKLLNHIRLVLTIRMDAALTLLALVQPNVMYRDSLPLKYIVWVQHKVTTGLERANCHLILNLIWQLNNHEFDFMF